MSKIKFYYEWLGVSKNHFKLLTMLAKNGGEFTGNYSDICCFLSLSKQSKNREKIKKTLDFLEKEDYILHVTDNKEHHLEIKPMEEEIIIPLIWVDTLINHDYSSKSVAWETILRVYLWIYKNNSSIITCSMIANDLNISKTTVGNAISVLEKEYKAILTRKVSRKVSDGFFISLGREIDCCGWWQNIQRDKKAGK